jgi:hypothetical protein
MSPQRNKHTQLNPRVKTAVSAKNVHVRLPIIALIRLVDFSLR